MSIHPLCTCKLLQSCPQKKRYQLPPPNIVKKVFLLFFKEESQYLVLEDKKSGVSLSNCSSCDNDKFDWSLDKWYWQFLSRAQVFYFIFAFVLLKSITFFLCIKCNFFFFVTCHWQIHGTCVWLCYFLSYFFKDLFSLQWTNIVNAFSEKARNRI